MRKPCAVSTLGNVAVQRGQRQVFVQRRQRNVAVLRSQRVVVVQGYEGTLRGGLVTVGRGGYRSGADRGQCDGGYGERLLCAGHSNSFGSEHGCASLTTLTASARKCSTVVGKCG